MLLFIKCQVKCYKKYIEDNSKPHSVIGVRLFVEWVVFRQLLVYNGNINNDGGIVYYG